MSTEGALFCSSTRLLVQSAGALCSLLLALVLLGYDNLPALEEYLDAYTLCLVWSASEDRPELVEYLRSSLCLLECEWSCLPGELFLDLFFASSVLPPLREELYTSVISGAFLFAELSDLESLYLPSEPLDSCILPLPEDEEDFTLSLSSICRSSPGLSGESISFGMASFWADLSPSGLSPSDQV